MSEELLKAMIAHWKMLKSTSIDGLRKTFLGREGRLVHSSEGWKLTVHRKTVDILLDYLPWSIGVVYHSWMLDPVVVSW